MRNHSHKLQAEFLEQLESLFGCAELVAVVPRRNVRIIETDELNPLVGGETKYLDGSGIDILTNSLASPQVKKLIVLHELRHALQLDVCDRTSKYTFCRGGKTARRAHIQSLMAEADAFTFQTVEVLKAVKNGSIDAGYLESMKKINPTIKEFLKKHPYQDETSFARLLFTEMMTDGLFDYHEQFKAYIELLIKMAPPRVENARKWFSEIPLVGDLPTSPSLTNIYGAEFMSQTSMRAIQTAFMRTLPLHDRAQLKKYEKVINSVSTMSQQEYMQSITSLRAAFAKAKLPWLAQILRIPLPSGETAELKKRKLSLKAAVL